MSPEELQANRVNSSLQPVVGHAAKCQNVAEGHSEIIHQMQGCKAWTICSAAPVVMTGALTTPRTLCATCKVSMRLWQG